MEILNLPAAKKLRFYSDMHIDFYIQNKNSKFDPKTLWYPEVLPEDKETILVLAGDIWHAKKPFTYNNYSWFSTISERFKYVLVVLGNHDFWNGQLPTEYDNFKRYTKERNLNNLILLQNNYVVIGEHKFLGATLWTDYANKDYDTIEEAKKVCNDFKYIRYMNPLFKGVFKKLTVANILEQHRISKNYIFENANKDYPEQKLWVITHHPPTDILITDPHIHKNEYGIITNNFEKEIKDSKIDYWIHGHNHQSGQAKVGNTLIMSNTVGYITKSDTNKELNAEYNPWIEIDLKFGQ